MIKPIKITHPEHDVWAVSDYHARHDRDFLWGKRGFKSVTEHDETLIHRWNTHLTSRSVCINMGDFIFGDPDGSYFKALVRRLNFAVMYLHVGNHVSGHRQVYMETLKIRFPEVASCEAAVYPLEYAVNEDPNKRVVFMPEYGEYSIGHTRLTCCHYPILSFNHQSKQAIHLTGHSHGGAKETNKDTGVGLRLDVGIESFGRPVSITEIKRHLAGRTLDIRDHHSGEDATP